LQRTQQCCSREEFLRKEHQSVEPLPAGRDRVGGSERRSAGSDGAAHRDPVASAQVGIAGVTVVTGCSHPGIKGNGVIKTDDRSISDFSEVVVSGGYKIKWSSGKPGLNVSAYENLLPLIKTVVSGNTPQIDSKEDPAPTKTTAIILRSTSLVAMQLSGGHSFKTSQISGHDLKIESSGAWDISIDGSVAKLEANLAGASKLNAKSLQTQTAKLSLLGASDAHVTVSDTLKVSVIGACSVTYSGNPKSVERNIIGAGSIRHLP
jgi:hypothetical protein